MVRRRSQSPATTGTMLAIECRELPRKPTEANVVALVQPHERDEAAGPRAAR